MARAVSLWQIYTIKHTKPHNRVAAYGTVTPFGCGIRTRGSGCAYASASTLIRKKTCVKVILLSDAELRTQRDNDSGFTVMPRYKVRREGESVRFGDEWCNKVLEDAPPADEDEFPSPTEEQLNEMGEEEIEEDVEEEEE